MFESTCESPSPDEVVAVRRPLTSVSVRPVPSPNSDGAWIPFPLDAPLPAACASWRLIEGSRLSACATLTSPRSVSAWLSMTEIGTGVSVAARRIRDPVTTRSSPSAPAAASMLPDVTADGGVSAGAGADCASVGVAVIAATTSAVVVIITARKPLVVARIITPKAKTVARHDPQPFRASRRAASRTIIKDADGISLRTPRIADAFLQ